MINDVSGSRTILEVLDSEKGSIRNVTSLLPVDTALFLNDLSLRGMLFYLLCGFVWGDSFAESLLHWASS